LKTPIMLIKADQEVESYLISLFTTRIADDNAAGGVVSRWDRYLLVGPARDAKRSTFSVI
jgi:hypothetical protein